MHDFEHRPAISALPDEAARLSGQRLAPRWTTPTSESSCGLCASIASPRS
jgi:hypothetical protein